MITENKLKVEKRFNHFKNNYNILPSKKRFRCALFYCT